MTKFACSDCGKEYLHPHTLRRHIASTHEESASHTCEECGKKFLRRDKLLRHKRTHQFRRDNTPGSTVVLENVCDECGKVFARRSNLLRHSKTHKELDSRDVTADVFASESLPNEVPSTSSHEAERLKEVEASAPPLASVADEELKDCLRRHWSSIRTRFKCQRVLDVFNFRLFENDEDIRSALTNVWREKITCRIKLNCSPAFVLRHKTTGELRYYHSSSNNACLFDKPSLIKSESNLSDFIEKLVEVDIRELVSRQRPNTAWAIECVTNLTFYMSKILPMGKVGRPVSLPSYLVKHKAILPLHRDNHRLPYDDNLCFFRCLAIVLFCQCGLRCQCSQPSEKEVTKLFKRYRRARDGSWTRRQFRGVGTKDLLLLEQLFEISITVFQLEPNGTSNVVWSTKSTHPRKLRLNLHDNHFSLIKRLDLYARSFDCNRCDQSYSRLSHLNRHNCSAAERRLKFTRSTFTPPPNIFKELEVKADIFVEPERRFYPYRITYDIECFMSSEELPEGSERLNYSARHELMSISVCSNVPDYTDPRCFVSDGSSIECIRNFVDYISRISERVNDILTDEFADVLELLNLKCEQQEEMEEPFKDAGISHPATYATRSLVGLQKKFLHYLSSVPVVGFNCQRYDLNVMKGPLIKFLHQRDKIRFTIKRESKLQCIETDMFRFLDISNFIAPGFSYERYLKVYECAQRKGFFPYEWFDSLDKLNDTQLPPHSAFFSSLTESNISPEEYRYCRDIWRDEGMETMRDFLIWYNNLDVVPFLEALEKQSEIYRCKGIDMLKSAISLPGLAIQWLFTEVDDECDVALIDERNKDLHSLIKDNLVGGPSIVFHRYHEKDITKIREVTFQRLAKTCKEVLGVDANALYLWSMMQKMPTGFVIRRKAERNFVPQLSKAFGKKALGWLQWVAEVRRVRIEHDFNKGERRIGQHGLPVDGYCEETRTVYQFHGCLFHGHKCHKTEGVERNPVNGKSMEALAKDTELKEDYIRSLGYNLERIYECEWDGIIDSCPELRQYLDDFYNEFIGDQRARTLDDTIRAIKDGEIFGLILCDIRVPEHLREKFHEMPPIFKNIQVSRNELSEHMADFVKETNHLRQPQRMLIGSMKGEKILILSELLRWYLEKGLEIDQIYEVFQFTPKNCFERFGASVSNARRMGDADPSKSLLADTAKLIGNSVYGKTITNKEKHRDVVFVDDDRKASNKVKNPRFISMDEIEDNFYEMMMEKRTITMNVPVVLGFTILQYAKLRMLQFYYDFMDRYVDRKDFQYVEMDTDSAYMALSGPLESVIRPHLRAEFYENYHQWFPSPYCSNHRKNFLDTKLADSTWVPQPCCLKRLKHDARTPGLFKEEFRGNGIVALNSKTYFCWSDDKQKLSSKGLSKRHNALTKEQYLNVLKDRYPVSGINKGFVSKNHQMLTYSQLRTGLTYFYAKRKVHEDGVSTDPID